MLQTALGMAHKGIAKRPIFFAQKTQQNVGGSFLTETAVAMGGQVDARCIHPLG